MLRVAAVNNAGLIATHESDGVIVDSTPPVVNITLYTMTTLLSTRSGAMLNPQFPNFSIWSVKQ